MSEAGAVQEDTASRVVVSFLARLRGCACRAGVAAAGATPSAPPAPGDGSWSLCAPGVVPDVFTKIVGRCTNSCRNICNGAERLGPDSAISGRFWHQCWPTFCRCWPKVVELNDVSAIFGQNPAEFGQHWSMLAKVCPHPPSFGPNRPSLAKVFAAFARCRPNIAKHYRTQLGQKWPNLGRNLPPGTTPWPLLGNSRSTSQLPGFAGDMLQQCCNLWELDYFCDHRPLQGRHLQGRRHHNILVVRSGVRKPSLSHQVKSAGRDSASKGRSSCELASVAFPPQTTPSFSVSSLLCVSVVWKGERGSSERRAHTGALF